MLEIAYQRITIAISGGRALDKALKYCILLSVCIFGLSGCGKGVGDILGGNTASTEFQQKPKIDPLARPIQVAWTSARAARCGFYFDSNQLRASYLAYEADQGASGQQIKKYQQAYDFTKKTVSKNIAGNPKYCKDKKRVEEIRTDLQRHLQGDYTPRPRKKSASLDDI